MQLAALMCPSVREKRAVATHHRALRFATVMKGRRTRQRRRASGKAEREGRSGSPGASSEASGFSGSGAGSGDGGASSTGGSRSPPVDRTKASLSGASRGAGGAEEGAEWAEDPRASSRWLVLSLVVNLLLCVMLVDNVMTRLSPTAAASRMQWTLEKVVANQDVTAEQGGKIMAGVLAEFGLPAEQQSFESFKAAAAGGPPSVNEFKDAPKPPAATPASPPPPAGTPTQTPASPAAIESVSVTVDEVVQTMVPVRGTDATVQTAAFCRRVGLFRPQYCLAVRDKVQAALEAAGAAEAPSAATEPARLARLAKDFDIFIAQPDEHTVYPLSAPVPMHLQLGSGVAKRADRVTGCVYIDDKVAAPLWCGPITSASELSIPANKLTPGAHLLWVNRTDFHAAKLGPDPVAHAVFFTVAAPSVSVDGISFEAANLNVGVSSAGTGEACVVVDQLTPPVRTGIHCVALAQDRDLSALVSVQLPFLLVSGFKYELYAVIRAPTRKVLSISDPVPFAVNGQVTARPELFPVATPYDWLLNLGDHEYGSFSQNGEDGVIAALFKNLGLSGGKTWWDAEGGYYVEFGAEDGVLECNTIALRERGWTGLLMDGGNENPAINLHKHFVTEENINALLDTHNVPAAFDLLVIDIDFNDFWVWRAILQDGRRRPRVVVLEINSNLGAESAFTVAYDAQRTWDGKTQYYGTSVLAAARLGAAHGYTLVYCESHGVNCFFVDATVLDEAVPGVAVPADALTVAKLFREPNYWGNGQRVEAKGEGAWVEVTP